MRVVRMDDIGFELLQQARQAPRRPEVHLGLGRERDEVEAFLGSLSQLAAGMGKKHRPMAERSQAQDRDEYLILTTAPRPRRVDV